MNDKFIPILQSSKLVLPSVQMMQTHPLFKTGPLSPQKVTSESQSLENVNFENNQINISNKRKESGPSLDSKEEKSVAKYKKFEELNSFSKMLMLDMPG